MHSVLLLSQLPANWLPGSAAATLPIVTHTLALVQDRATVALHFPALPHQIHF